MSKVEFSRRIDIRTLDKGGTTIEDMASDAECTALAARFELAGLSGVHMKATIKPRGDGMTYHVRGRVVAHVTQDCIVTGQPVETDINDDFEAWFRDESVIASLKAVRNARKNMDDETHETEMQSEEDDPEAVTDGHIDIGELAAQYIGLAIDPYPRCVAEGEGDRIESAPDNAQKQNPFAALSALKTKE